MANGILAGNLILVSSSIKLGPELDYVQCSYCSAMTHLYTVDYTKAVSELAATARFPRHHVMKYRTSLATPLATAVADSALNCPIACYASFMQFSL